MAHKLGGRRWRRAGSRPAGRARRDAPRRVVAALSRACGARAWLGGAAAGEGSARTDAGDARAAARARRARFLAAAGGTHAPVVQAEQHCEARAARQRGWGRLCVARLRLPVSMAWRACDVHSSHGFSMSYAMAALATLKHSRRASRRSAVARAIGSLGSCGRAATLRRAEPRG